MRSAADIGTRRRAIGLDLGAPVLEVARRGFSSTFSNQMGQLGRWISVPVGADRVAPPPVLHLLDDVVGALVGRAPDGARDDDGQVERIGLAAPGWLGWADRHHVTRLVDPAGRAEVVWASTPLVAAFATSAVGSAALDAEVVVAVDLDIGVSAAVVSIDRCGVREQVAAALAPSTGTRSEAVATVLAELASAAAARGVLAANRIVLVADGPASSSLVEAAIRALDQPWGECPVDVVRSRGDIARAVIELAEMDGIEVVNVVPCAVGVLLDDRADSDLHVIVPRHQPMPFQVTARVDLGPDDGSDVFLDLYEAPGAAAASSGNAVRPHSLVLSAQLVPAAEGAAGAAPSAAREVDVLLEVGLDGSLSVSPAGAARVATWTCSWAPSQVVISVAELARSQAGRLARLDGSSASPEVPTRAREMAPPIGLAEALGRAERFVSRRVGRPVAIRSAMALLGLGDRDDVAALAGGADRLERVLATWDDGESAHTLRVALDVARRAIEGPLGRVYAGGSAHEVAREIERVIEHLGVVIGAVTPAERNRLIDDAQLLGLEHDRARSLVHELIDQLRLDTDGPPDPARDRNARVVVGAHGLRLGDADEHVGPDETVIRVLLLDS